MASQRPMAPDGVDPTRRFYRLRHVRDDGFIEFEFAIGSPELSVELILPRSAFDAFRRMPGMEAISDAEAERCDRELNTYLYGTPEAPTPHDHPIRRQHP